MKVSIIGNGLTSLTLAKMLVNHGISVDIFSNNKKKNNEIQTLGISKTNIEFFNNNILDINKFLWNINKIEIYSENLLNEKILNFQNKNNELFSIIKNFDLYNFLYFKLKKNRFIKFKKTISLNELLKKDYKLIFNCESNNAIFKKFFFKKIEKNYNSFAYITTLEHQKLPDNHIASQVFTKNGPLAFLPISPNETSVVYSIKDNRKIDLESLIRNFNSKYKILKINKILNFELKSSNLRSYSFKNIIAFGDPLHKLHPLAGQGFNMTIRDIKEIHRLIKLRKELGLGLDSSIGFDFEKNTISRNYLFSRGIDFIYEFFNFENKINNPMISKSIKFFGKQKFLNKLLIKFADNGLVY